MKNTFVIKDPETTLHPNRAMTPRKLLVFASLFTTVAASVVAADTNGPAASKSDYTVALHYEKEIPLNSEAVQTLYSNAVDLLETSNFNSRAPLWDWSISKLHEQYRQTVSGKYLIVSFKVPRKFATVGGEVSVREIVIGMNRPDYASALFTIDGEGRVVGHAKYSGPKCIELLNAVKQIANDADGQQRRLYFRNSVDCGQSPSNEHETRLHS